jgi:hypothetical protein
MYHDQFLVSDFGRVLVNLDLISIEYYWLYFNPF